MEFKSTVLRIFFVGVVLGALAWTYYFFVSERVRRTEPEKSVVIEEVLKERLTPQSEECANVRHSGC